MQTIIQNLVFGLFVGSIYGVGAFPAGLLLGLAEAVSGITIGAAYREVVGLVLFLVVLLVRPQGLFGKS